MVAWQGRQKQSGKAVDGFKVAARLLRGKKGGTVRRY